MVYFRVDTTRIEYSIPLRENWALPYFACQVAALTGYLKRNLNTYAEVRHRSVLYITANSDARLVLMLSNVVHVLFVLRQKSPVVQSGFKLIM